MDLFQSTNSLRMKELKKKKKMPGKILDIEVIGFVTAEEVYGMQLFRGYKR